MAIGLPKQTVCEEKIDLVSILQKRISDGKQMGDLEKFRRFIRKEDEPDQLRKYLQKKGER